MVRSSRPQQRQFLKIHHSACTTQIAHYLKINYPRFSQSTHLWSKVVMHAINFYNNRSLLPINGNVYKNGMVTFEAQGRAWSPQEGQLMWQHTWKKKQSEWTWNHTALGGKQIVSRWADLNTGVNFVIHFIGSLVLYICDPLSENTPILQKYIPYNMHWSAMVNCMRVSKKFTYILITLISNNELLKPTKTRHHWTP